MMNEDIIGKTFNADIKSLYEHIGDNETEWGYRIRHSVNNGVDYYDLHGHNTPILICNGEKCEVAECYEDSVRVICLEFSLNTGITFSKEEFYIISNRE